MKASLPAGQLPVMEIDDGTKSQIVDQSNAILRYVGKLAGSYPSDPMEALEVDAIIDTCEEANKFIGFSMHGPKSMFYGEDSLTDQEKLDIRKKIMDPSIPKNTAFFLSILEKKLDQNNTTGWFVGDKPTIADFRVHQIVAWLLAGILDGIPTTCMDAYPLLKAHHDKIEALPAVTAFRKEHGKKYSADFHYKP